MAHLHFTANLQRHLRCPPQEFSGATVAEVLQACFAERPQLRGYILEDDGSLRKHMNIFVRGAMIADRQALSDAVAENDEIYVMQALSGG